MTHVTGARSRKRVRMCPQSWSHNFVHPHFHADPCPAATRLTKMNCYSIFASPTKDDDLTFLPLQGIEAVSVGFAQRQSIWFGSCVTTWHHETKWSNKNTKKIRRLEMNALNGVYTKGVVWSNRAQWASQQTALMYSSKSRLLVHVAFAQPLQ